MRRLTQTGIIMVIGVIVVSSTLNGLFLNFVKPSLRIPLIIASVVLVALSLYGVFVEDRRRAAVPLAESMHSEGEDGVGAHGHDHAGGPRIGWLLIVPFLLMSMVSPPPLGAYSAARDGGGLRIESANGLEPLTASDGPVDISLSEYSARAIYDPGRSLEGRTVALTGFSSPGEEKGSWVLTRMALACCAADGYAIKVVVKNAPPVPTDSWVRVVGTWEPSATSEDPNKIVLPIVVVTNLTPVAMPEQPYE